MGSAFKCDWCGEFHHGHPTATVMLRAPTMPPEVRSPGYTERDMDVCAACNEALRTPRAVSKPAPDGHSVIPYLSREHLLTAARALADFKLRYDGRRTEGGVASGALVFDVLNRMQCEIASLLRAGAPTDPFVSAGPLEPR